MLKLKASSNEILFGNDYRCIITRQVFQLLEHVCCSCALTECAEALTSTRGVRGGTCKQPSRTAHRQGRTKPCPDRSHKLPRTEELPTSTALPGRACGEQGRCRSARPGALRAPSRRLGGGPGARRPVAQLREGQEKRAGAPSRPPRCRGADLPLPSPRRLPPPPPGPPGTSGPLPHPGPGARQVAAAAEPGWRRGRSNGCEPGPDGEVRSERGGREERSGAAAGNGSGWAPGGPGRDGLGVPWAGSL